MEVRYNAKNGDNAKALVMSTREGFASNGAEKGEEDGADADMIDGELEGMAENAADEDGPGDFADMENQAELGEDDGSANASEQNEHKT
jgi:hypothetical protein